MIRLQYGQHESHRTSVPLLSATQRSHSPSTKHQSPPSAIPAPPTLAASKRRVLSPALHGDTKPPLSGSPPPHSIEILSRVQAFLHRRDASGLILDNTDPETFRILEQKADTGDLPGWDSVQCACIGNWLFLMLTMVSTVSIIMGKTRSSFNIHYQPTKFSVQFSCGCRALVC